MKNLLLLAVILVGAAYFGSKFYLHYRVSEAVDNAVLMAAPFADIRYRGVSSTFSGELSIDDVTLRLPEFRDPLVIDRLTMITPGYFFLLNLAEIGQPGEDFEVPERFGFSVTGLRASTSSDYLQKFFEATRLKVDADDRDSPAAVCTGKYGFSPETLRELGYRDLDISLSMAYRQDERELFLDLTADIADMYRIDTTVQFADRLTPASLMGGKYRPRLAAGRLEYHDQSLRERTVELCARQGLSPDEIRVAQLDSFAASARENGLEFDEYVMEPYREFLDGRSTFILTASPGEPVNFSQIGLYKPSDVPALLNLEGAVY